MKDNYEYIQKLILPKNEINNTNKIPKVIIQTFETNYLPKRMIKKGCKSWIELNPTYTYKFFDADDRKKFIKDNFDENVLKAYYKLNHGALKSDLFRYCYLYIHGGVYSDIDQVCIKSLDTFIKPDDDFITGLRSSSKHLSLIHI